MANTTDITLTNALAATIPAYWGRMYDPVVNIGARSPYLNMLRARGRVFDSTAMKTGTQVYEQTIGSTTEVTTLAVSATNEFFQMPSYLEYNIPGFQKKLVITKEQISLLMGDSSVGLSSVEKKKKEALVRAGVRNLREQFMALHFRQMMYDIDRRLVTDVSGSQMKSLEDVINPSTGPSSSFEGFDLTALDVTVNQPLWVKASGGTGTTNLNEALTGGTMNYANMLKWVSVMQQTQITRGGKYDVVMVTPTVYNTLSNMVENRIQYQADPRYILSAKPVPNTLLGKNGVPIQSHIAAITINEIPVLQNPNLGSDNYVWLLDTDAINLDFFDPDKKDGGWYDEGPMKQMEAFIRVYARMTSTTLEHWGDSASVVLKTYLQQSFQNFGGIGLIVFDATSTT